MTSDKHDYGGRLSVRKPSRLVQVCIIAISLGAVTVIRFATERRRANDAIKYADIHEATDLLTEILAKAPERDKLAISLKYMNSESPGMRYAAVDSLDHARKPGVADALEHAFQDSSTEVRKRVLDLMPAIDAQRGYRILLSAVQDEDCWVKDHAMTLLAANSRQRKSYIDAQAVPILMHAMTDPDPTLAPLAIPILMKLVGVSGKSWRYSLLNPEAEQVSVRERWTSWWAVHRAGWPTGELENTRPVLPTLSDQAPEFIVKDIDGNRINLSDLKGRVVLLNFWGTWCPPCMVELPGIIAVDREYRSRGLETIGIAVAEKSVSGLRDWCLQHGITYPQVVDSDYIGHIYGDCFEVPVSVLIDKRGMIRRRWDGERDFTTFHLAVERLLKE
jgi:peroxiredoxin